MSQTVLAAGTVLDASGSTGPLAPQNDTAPVRVTVNVTAVSGSSPSLVVTAQPATPPTITRPDTSTAHAGAVAFPPADGYDPGMSTPPITGPGTYTLTLDPASYGGGRWPRCWRLAWTVSAGASFTLGALADTEA